MPIWEPPTPNWRDQPSIVGRGQWRCCVCQEVIQDDDDKDWIDGFGNAHERCIVAEEEAGTI